ncbi:MAG: polyprenol monophosphomannose synthase, partial [Chloroflexi bacterium]|nr:polyprenol monophosphomannose synthase [Chloroflexota bacterium]
DDNSPDGTGQVAAELAERHPGRVHLIRRPGKQGLGTAYVLGFQWALNHGADYIIEMDADFSHSPSYIPLMLQKAQEYDVVVGSRYVPGAKIDERWSLWRRFLSWGGNVYARLITGLKVLDTTAGFKCFSRSALAALPLNMIHSDGYAFQVEMAYACQRRGHRVLEIPITFLERTRGASKMSLHIVLEAAWRVWRIRLSD